MHSKRKRDEGMKGKIVAGCGIEKAYVGLSLILHIKTAYCLQAFSCSPLLDRLILESLIHVLVL